MSNEIISPYMNLPIPVAGVDPGPQYALDVNSCLSIIDQHNHTPGQGVQIPPSGLNINSDLTFQGNNATNLLTARFLAQVSPIPATGLNLDCIYVSGVDLYYNDGVGNQVRMTQNGGVAGTPGSISNLTPPATASYNSVSSTFVFESNANTPANIDVASVVLRNLVSGSPGLTLSPPTLGSSYTITLPTLPASTLPLSISNTGQMSAAQITLTQLSTPIQQAITTAPTQQIFTGGSGTYTLPSGPAPLYIEVEMVGGGAGGAGAASSGPATGGDGGTTTFGSSFLVANGGSGSTVNAPGGAGGTTSIGVGATGIGFQGAQGGPSVLSGEVGGSVSGGGGGGGNSPFGGAGTGYGGTNSPYNGFSAISNTGSGGGGGGTVIADSFGGSGGGAGGYIKVIIASPTSSYPYSIGAGGTAGAGNISGGGQGANGIIIVREYYS